jgi:hypothetical protein
LVTATERQQWISSADIVFFLETTTTDSTVHLKADD